MIKGDLFIIRETAQILIGAKVHCQSTPTETSQIPKHAKTRVKALLTLVN